MTPAVELAKKRKVDFLIHSYEHDPSAASYGLEAAEVLGHDPAKVFKTFTLIKLIFVCNGVGEYFFRISWSVHQSHEISGLDNKQLKVI